MEKILRVENISKSFDNGPVIEDVSFSLDKGEIGCLLGPSGCGKTTLLRIIAGFEAADKGTVALHDRTVSDGTTTVKPENRKVGMVFQDYALFPHLTVKGNIAFGLNGYGPEERERRVMSLIAKIELKGFEDSYPHEMSGGQQQRVALARALAPEPEIILMDEPFSNLDVTLREDLSREVRRIIKDMGSTALLVTHNQQEAFAMADGIGVMKDGRMLQWGTAHEIYHMPVDRKVASFIGEGVLLSGKVVEDAGVKTAIGFLKGHMQEEHPEGSSVDVLIRPEDIVHDDNSPCIASIEQKDYRGPNILFTLRTSNGERILSLVPSHHNHEIGEKLGIRVDVEDLVVFPREPAESAA